MPPLALPAAVSSARRTLPEDTPLRTTRVALDPADPKYLALQQQFVAQGCAPYPCTVGGVAHLLYRCRGSLAWSAVAWWPWQWGGRHLRQIAATQRALG